MRVEDWHQFVTITMY